jgi:integrase
VKFPLKATGLRDAKVEIIQIKANIGQGQDGRGEVPAPRRMNPDKVDRPTIAEAVRMWLDELKTSVRPSSWECCDADLRAWSGALTERNVLYLDKITTEPLADIIGEWKRTKGEAKVSRLRMKRRLATLRRVLSWAKFRNWIEVVPFDGDFSKELIGKKEPTQVRRFLKKDEVLSVIRQARAMKRSENNRPTFGPMLADILELMMYSGLREQEANTLRWRNVRFSEKCLVIEDEKRPQEGHFKEIPFNDGLQKVLSRLRKQAEAADLSSEDDFIFCGKTDSQPVSNLRALLLKVAKKVGLENFAFDPRRAKEGVRQSPHLGFHDFRRFFATQLANNKVPLKIASQWFGHKDGGILFAKTYVKEDKELGRKIASELKI